MSRFNLSAWAVANPAIVLFLMLLSLGAGTMSYLALGRAEDPSFTIKTMVVTAVWPGASAEDMQRQVSDPIETRLRTMPNLDYIQSYSRQNVSVLQILLKDSTRPEDVADLWYQVRKKVGDLKPTLPAGLRGPFFNDEYSDVYGALFMLTAPELPQKELLPYVERMRQRLLAIPDIDKVEIFGERPRRIFVDLSYKRLATLGIAPNVIFDSLRLQNDLVPAGAIETPTERINVKIDGALTNEEAVANTPIIAGGKTFLLRDIATVSRGYEDPPSSLARFNGTEAIGLAVRMRDGANGLALGEALEKAQSEVEATLPLGIELHQTSNQAEVIDESISEFLLKFVIAVAVVLLISFVALGYSAGVIVALSVPLTLALTFVVMEIAGMQFHRITLGALILALGLLVDDAIIAIEMMLVKIEEGFDRVSAATFAWNSTAFPMLTGTLITIAGFLPVGFAKSTAGEYAGGIFTILLIALSISWVVAVVFTPFLGVKLLPKSLEAKAAARGHHYPYDTKGFDRFRSIVSNVIKIRWLIIAVTIAAFGVAGFIFTKIPQQFFPTSERRELLINLRGAEGASITQTLAEVAKVEARLKGDPHISFFNTYVGQGAPRFYLALNPALPNENFAQIVIVTKGNVDREELRTALTREFAETEGAVRARVLRLDFGPPTGHPVQFRVSGPDANIVRRIAEQVRDEMRAEPRARDVELEWGEQAKSIRYEVDQTRARALGVSSNDIALTLQTFLSGFSVTEIREDNRLVDVVARAVPEERSSVERLDDIVIPTGNGGAVPLSQIARQTIVADEPIIWRRNSDVVLSVRADVIDGVQAPDVTKAILPRLQLIIASLAPGYKIELGGAIEQSAKANAALLPVFPVMLLIMLTLIMLQVKSFSKMTLVFLTFPLGFIGASFALLISGKPFGFVALLGILALGGIIVRNTLILADQIDSFIDQGMDLRNAIIETTVRRARPVILTAFAAVLAFIPLTLTAFWGPMAIVLIGGTLVGTVLTLFFLPALYAAWFGVGRSSSLRGLQKNRPIAVVSHSDPLQLAAE